MSTCSVHTLENVHIQILCSGVHTHVLTHIRYYFFMQYMRKEMLRQIKLFNIVQLTSDEFKMQTGFSVMEYHHVPTEP